ncbi:MAG: sugar transferase [Eubacteriales bacterium]|nr:sugar transferase [Eubacteriales bacterium]MDY2826611.1 sugar transferase [Eubacteriales bacterium]
MYAKYFKRFFDFWFSLMALLLLLPLFLILSVTGSLAMRGNPFFVQPRPGKKGEDGKEKIFYLFKFRTMSNKKDREGRLLPDAARLNGYGRFLRSTSLDELPSLLNVLKGDLALVGPRPQLVRDMVFMTARQRRRHEVRPGLTGLAQINGRNNITWEQKFEYDLAYIEKGITARGDIAILLKTVVKVFKRADTVRDGTASDIDLGDWLMREGKIDSGEYREKQQEAKELLGV